MVNCVDGIGSKKKYQWDTCCLFKGQVGLYKFDADQEDL